LIAPIIKIRCLFDLFTEKKIQQTPNFNLISPTKMNMKTKQWDLDMTSSVTKNKPIYNKCSTLVSFELFVWWVFFRYSIYIFPLFSFHVHFCSARALNYFKKDKKMLAAFPLKKFHPLA
jgi:hypothetical protein